MRGRIAVPEWMPMREWTAYLDMRERIRKGATEYAQALLVKKLTHLRNQGHSVSTVLNRHTQNEWPGIPSSPTGGT